MAARGRQPPSLRGAANGFPSAEPSGPVYRLELLQQTSFARHHSTPVPIGNRPPPGTPKSHQGPKAPLLSLGETSAPRRLQPRGPPFLRFPSGRPGRGGHQPEGPRCGVPGSCLRLARGAKASRPARPPRGFGGGVHPTHAAQPETPRGRGTSAAAAPSPPGPEAQRRPGPRSAGVGGCRHLLTRGLRSLGGPFPALPASRPLRLRGSFGRGVFPERPRGAH